MKLVGIRELKSKLSRYITEAKKGEGLIVTDRGQFVAAIHPLSNEFRVVQYLLETGKASWSGKKPRGLSGPVALKGKPLSETILEERQ